ncbi:MAG: hypothetical protein J6M39_08260 [Lachnospiraceae bacterium]|nr:hypothetical protein [Lachnospiraceae bacterium]
MKVFVLHIIALLIAQFVRIIDERWFVLGFVLLLTFILLGALSYKLGRKDKSNNLETDN